MVRSFDYAFFAGMRHQVATGTVTSGSESYELLNRVLGRWSEVAADLYVRSYVAAMKGLGLLPSTTAESERLLAAYLLDKSCYELGYELNHRPKLVGAPIAGIRAILDGIDRYQHE